MFIYIALYVISLIVFINCGLYVGRREKVFIGQYEIDGRHTTLDDFVAILGGLSMIGLISSSILIILM